MSILVAMSESVDARLASYLLTQLDRDVLTVGTLAEAERHALERSWTAIILDTTLSDGSGFDLLHTLTRMGFDGAILMLSATKTVATKVRALEEGADDYVVRPYEPSELLARVKAIVRRSRRRIGKPETGLVRVGPIELDMHTLAVSLPGNRRERLTPNEMRLLHYLMTHAERIVDHQDLATWLFGMAVQAAGSNAVSVYMRRVRRKIEVDPNHPRYIITVRGSGYRFSAVEEPTLPAVAVAGR